MMQVFPSFKSVSYLYFPTLQILAIEIKSTVIENTIKNV